MRRQQQKGMKTVTECRQKDGEAVGQRQVKKEKEKRNAAKDKQRIARRKIPAIPVAQDQQRGAERHQQKQQRRWIFAGVEKREGGEKQSRLVRPFHCIAVVIPSAKRDK